MHITEILHLAASHASRSQWDDIHNGYTTLLHILQQAHTNQTNASYRIAIQRHITTTTKALEAWHLTRRPL